MAKVADTLTALMLGRKASQDAELFCALAKIDDGLRALERERDAYRASCHAAARNQNVLREGMRLMSTEPLLKEDGIDEP